MTQFWSDPSEIVKIFNNNYLIKCTKNRLFRSLLRPSFYKENKMNKGEPHFLFAIVFKGRGIAKSGKLKFFWSVKSIDSEPIFIVITLAKKMSKRIRFWSKKTKKKHSKISEHEGMQSRAMERSTKSFYSLKNIFIVFFSLLLAF